MARADDDEARRRRGRARPRAPPPTSIASMYAPVDAASRQPPAPQRSSKMKMASLMAVADEADAAADVVGPQSKSKRVKVDQREPEGWAPRSAPISISSLTSSAEPSFSASDEQPPQPQPASSLFQTEMPTVIQSFSEERRREAAPSNGESKNGAAVVTAAAAANGDASPAATRSMYDFFFPSGRTEANGASGSRSLKRKRRGARRGDELAATGLDLLRFGVDAAKLVPQGLVDRVDVHMSRAVLVKVVGDHVVNWCNRSGFAPSFLQEITTLLAAYYPCNYPTLLDEVLAGFLFKRPEFMDLLLPAMLEKMNRAGESASPTKYPVADALVRMCATPAVRTAPQAAARHDLACRSLLRCLVEHNGDRFVLSPWIAACAIESSDRVLHTLWRALLPRPPVAEDRGSPDEEDPNWRIEDPAQQIVELLAEEGKLRVCRITCGFVKLLLTDEGLKKQLVDSQSYLIPDCLERALKYASTSWSASVMAEWLERRRKQQPEGTEVVGSLNDLVDFFVRFNSKLSVKKPEWFANHVLSFVLSPQCHAAEQEAALRSILRDHMSFVFGGVDTQSLAQKSKHNGSSETAAASTSVASEDLDVVGSQSALEVRSKVELLVGLLTAANARTSALFLGIWSEAWADKRATLAWGYVHALLCVVIQGTVEDRSELGQMLQSFTTRVCRSYYYRLSRNLDKDNSQDEVTIKFSEALSLLLPCTRPVAGALLQEVLGALADFEQQHSDEACSIFGNTVTLHLGSCGDGGVDISVKRSVVQKSLVEYDRSPANPATSPTATAHLLTMLKTLASTKNDTGDFTRRVLSSGLVVRLLAGLLNIGRRRRRQEMLLDVMNVVVINNTSTKRNREWSRQYVVQELVYCAYTGPPNSARKAIALLQHVFRHSTNDVRALLWVVLQQCTRLCCGREEMVNGDNSVLLSGNYQGRADTFAELVTAMVVTVPASTVREVVSFVEQKLASCSVGKTRMNLFLLLLLRKLVVCELQCGVLLPVVQLAVCPLAPSDLDQIRLIQLQLLKALCTRLIAVRHRPVASKLSGAAEDWKRCEDLLCNERLQSDLRSMAMVAPLASGGMYCKVERTSRVSEVLAQGILAFTHQLKQQSPHRR
ncbi:hypothetical protein PHYPSEUDO_009568 [Phytophthora pseudosyringae]|uniref:Uncharacterized protein n=1 Tax=Phytophthora pseudosyringae TaxID=221518 RepID=A0A8T1WLN8_9STRA|nr:hypothetical protein PHYPSEUDO_009568 [Phytophthora pseudosyringae]